MKKAAVAILTAALFASTAPLAAFTLVERGATFETHVTLQQAALCDGSVRLEPGAYKLQIASTGDNSVRASFIDRTGRRAGEANGIIAVLRQRASGPGDEKIGPGSSEHKAQPGSPDEATALKQIGLAPRTQNFTKLGFGENSRSKFKTEGRKLNLEIFSADGSHSILIGLLLPAVQKVREAAAPPAR